MDDVTIELLYFGVTKDITDKINGQAYAGFGYDDELTLGVLDLGRTINSQIKIGARYQYFDTNGNNDQHSAWVYLNAEQFFAQSWRIDTRQVIEQRIATTGVSDRTRYRPRFRLSYFGNAVGRNYQLYGSVEPVLNLSEDNNDQTSWAGGAYLELNSRTQLNGFYQYTETERGPDIHFPGIGLLFTF
ncbi:MAG: DUF2490 domain-containing protein [Pseudomonadota bacterium]